jgi:hypothetical protein
VPAASLVRLLPSLGLMGNRTQSAGMAPDLSFVQITVSGNPRF